jgi:hypothetical protein
MWRLAKFEREFVFFSSEDKGYEVATGKNPRGHIEIERKGERLNFKIFIENLKEMIYQIQLFTFGGNYVILDEISIGKGGKKEGQYRINSLNVLNSGIRWQEFDVVVIRPLGPEHSRKVPLVAWLNNSKDEKWKIPYIKDRVAEDLKDPEPIYEEVVEKEEIKEGFKERPIEVGNNKGEGFIQEPGQSTNESDGECIEEPIEENFQEDIFIEENFNVEKEEELGEGDIISEEIARQGMETSDSEEYWVDYDREALYYYVNQNIPKLEKILPESTPFYPPMKNHRWWEIKEDQENLDGFYLYFNGSFVDIRYPYMGYENIEKTYSKEYENKIFGIVYNDEMEDQLGYFVYGIPGRLCLQDQPFKGDTGFLYWHPSKGNQNVAGEMGYWLLYVEAQSGIIAIPKRPTIAPNCQD